MKYPFRFDGIKSFRAIVVIVYAEQNDCVDGDQEVLPYSGK